MPILLISLLGTGNYHATAYVMKSQSAPLPPTAYHQEVLGAALQPEFRLLVRTVEAEAKHGSHFGSEWQRVLIPKCANDKEFWEAFEAIVAALDSLPQNSSPWQIHLDLTHGFRTQPMFLLSAIRYWCQLHPERGNLAEVYYSMYEAGQEGPTPVVEVTPILEMERIATEVRAFLEHGASQALAERLERLEKQRADEARQRAEASGVDPKLRGRRIAEERRQDPLLNLLADREKGLAPQLRRFSELVGLNYTPGCADNVRRLCELARQGQIVFIGEFQPLGRAFATLAQELDAFFPPGARPLWRWHAALALWCLKRHFLQQALTHVNELLTTRWCEETDRDPLDPAQRDQLLRLALDAGQPRRDLPPEWIALLNQDLNVGNIRNRVNHAFCNRGDDSDISKLPQRIREQIEQVLQAHSKIDRLAAISPSTPPMTKNFPPWPESP